jgi:hypothetical protein
MSKREDKDNFNKYVKDAIDNLDLARVNLIRVGMLDGVIIFDGYIKTLLGIQKMVNSQYKTE